MEEVLFQEPEVIVWMPMESILGNPSRPREHKYRMKMPAEFFVGRSECHMVKELAVKAESVNWMTFYDCYFMHEDKYDILEKMVEITRFLMIKVLADDLSGDALVRAPPMIKKVWKTLMSCSELYQELCIALCGEMIVCDPTREFDPEQMINTRRKLTSAMWYEAFPRTPQPLLWCTCDLCENQGGCGHSASRIIEDEGETSEDEC